MTDRRQLMNQVWACIEQAFVAGDLERASRLEHYLSVLEDLATAEREGATEEVRPSARAAR